MLTSRLLCALILSASANLSVAASVASDEDLRLTLIGSWVNPPGQSVGVSIPARQIFRANGTTTLYVYPTLECRVPAAYFEGNWAVVSGVLITQITGSTLPAVVPVGMIEQIEIVAVDSNRMVLKADEALYVREKSETCYAEDARKT